MLSIRVLVVDDSVVVRKLLCAALASMAQIEAVGTAASGTLALAKIPQLNPDVITLDIEMPGLNGIQTLTEIRKLYPKLPVIMCSTLTERGAAITLEALTSESLAGAMEQVAQQLGAKIISLSGRSPTGSRLSPPLTHVRKRVGNARVEIVAIGTSTGGPNALAEVIPHLPPDFPVPVVAVQHMPALFTRLLAERLNSRSRLSVKEGAAGKPVLPGTVWIAPGDYHMTVAKKGAGTILGLNGDPPENSCRPAVDVLFRSVARVYGANVLAVVMTGMGSDGARGAAQIHEAGGQVLVQDEASSIVWGMPGAVVEAEAADKICPLTELCPEIVRRVTASRVQALCWQR